MAQWAHNCEHPLSFCPANVRYYTLLHSHQCGGSSWPARARASCGAMRRSESEGEYHQHQPVNASNNHPSWEKQARKLNKKHLQHSNVQNEVRLVRWIGLERPKLRSIRWIVCPLMWCLTDISLPPEYSIQSPIDHLPGKQFHWSLNNPWWQLNAKFEGETITFDLTFNGTKVWSLLPIHVLKYKFAQNCHSSKIGWDLFFKEVEDDGLKTAEDCWRLRLSCHAVYISISGWQSAAVLHDGTGVLHTACCMLQCCRRGSSTFSRVGWPPVKQSQVGCRAVSTWPRCAHTHSSKWPEQNYAERGTDLESAWINH